MRLSAFRCLLYLTCIRQIPRRSCAAHVLLQVLETKVQKARGLYAPPKLKVTGIRLAPLKRRVLRQRAMQLG